MGPAVGQRHHRLAGVRRGRLRACRPAGPDAGAAARSGRAAAAAATRCGVGTVRAGGRLGAAGADRDADGRDLAVALSPPVDADSLAYHFAVPKQMLAAGGWFSRRGRSTGPFRYCNK